MMIKCIHPAKNVIQVFCVVVMSIFYLTGCTTMHHLAFWEKAPALEIPPISDEYIIGCGDVLNISVWKDEALTRQVVVLPDGSIAFPLIGKVKAKDQTVQMLNDLLNKKISRYVPEPNISVQVVKTASMKIYILGKVNRPGMFIIEENINILQALALSGGLTPFADQTKIKIYRRNNGQVITIPFNYKEVIKKDKQEQNIQLQRGDLVVVP